MGAAKINCLTGTLCTCVDVYHGLFMKKDGKHMLHAMLNDKLMNRTRNDHNKGKGYLVVGSTGSEAVQGSFALRVSHTRQDLLPALGAHLPHGGQVLSLHALHQRYLHTIRAGDGTWVL